MRKPQQLRFTLPTWGGQRRGAGRPPKGDKAGVSHRARPQLTGREPVHVTLKVVAGVGHLRKQRQLHAIEEAFRRGKSRFGLHLAHYSVQGTHLHLLVEPEAGHSLSRGMQGLTVRLARALNRLAVRKGRVFADRFHAHVLATRREVANALRYVLRNFAHHCAPDAEPIFAVDPCSSERFIGQSDDDGPVLPPRTWCLRTAVRAWALAG